MLEVAISPCPNDTFLFYGWSAGYLASPLVPSLLFGDIQQLNEWALEKKYPLIKVSAANLAKLHEYELLPVGAALGWNVGPKIIAKKKISPDEIKTIALPGQNTTAHFLCDLFFPHIKKKVFCRYGEIAARLNEEDIDAGVIIHESRFTFLQKGFIELADLGTLWHERFNLPLPLGALVLHKDQLSLKETIIDTLRQSLNFAKESPILTKKFIIHHAREKNWEIVKKHIDLYVTDETAALSSQGQEAIKLMTQLSHAHSLCNPT